jgi:tRNA (cmo5U34)-methyltransferase
MERQEPQAIFDQKCASGYDQQWSKLPPLRDALHLLIGAVLSDLPADARVSLRVECSDSAGRPRE